MNKKSPRFSGGTIVAVMLVGCAALPGLSSAASVLYSAHSNSAGGVLANAGLVNYGTVPSPSYGVRNSGEGTSSPNHAIDNSGYVDAVRLNFSNSVRLTGVTFSWGPGDTDFSVLYSTGASPCLNSNSYAALSSCGGGNNWSLLNSYNSSGTGLKNLSNTTVFARNWLVVAYYAFDNSCVGCDAGDDYFKLSGVQYVERVPEPGTLALLGLGIASLGLSRRRRR
jgi:hypothetical protein